MDWLRQLCGRRNSLASSQVDGLRSTIGPPPLPPRAELSAVSSSAAALCTEALQPDAVQEQPISVIEAEVMAAVPRAVKTSESKVQRLKEQLRNPEEAEVWRLRGTALRSASDELWSPELKQITLPMPLPSANSEEQLTIDLPKPGQPFTENAATCFKTAEKIEKGNERCASLLEAAKTDAERWKGLEISLATLQPKLGSDADAERVLREIQADLRAAGFIKTEVVPSRATIAESLRRKHGKDVDCFLSPSGYEVIAGRSAAANERVSYELTPKDAFWFHSADGVAGSHVAILHPASDVRTLEDVEFAAAIAAWHSKARAEPTVAVTYCYGEQVGRPLVPKLGQVTIRGRRGRILVTPALPKES
eukprot:TRINITY_DN28592_c0_g1_i1.p1 TRINITY_DN28592_c0_g1~~TRINITY_DN28592_c0_g1_i1.p1  ORF type:complete len:364 (-),score=71.17 TRINITY_DN28592_c0_g1_i1:16-1107(-)